MKRQRGQCRLCLNERELCNSHIIPEFGYKNVYVQDLKGNRLQKLSVEPFAKPELTHHKKGFREFLLCEDCENKFSVWETYVANLLNRNIPDQTSGTLILEVEYVKLRMFLLSILWRSSISTLELFQPINLEHSDNELLRRMLWEENPGDFHHYSCMATLLTNDRTIEKELLDVSNGLKIESLRIYRIIFYGIIWTFLVGSHGDRLSDRRNEELFIQPDTQLILIPKEMSTIDFLMKSAQIIFEGRL